MLAEVGALNAFGLTRRSALWQVEKAGRPRGPLFKDEPLPPDSLSPDSPLPDMTLADVVRFTAYVTDRAYFPVYGAVRSRYVAGNAFASTLVIVSGFTRPEFKIEVEVTAVAS